MIQPNEVRIGNWVMCLGEPFQIHTISKVYPFLDTDKFGAGVFEWKNIEPIRIDMMFLERMGFKAGYTAMILMKDSFTISYLFGKLSIMKANEYELYKTKVDFIHQLQNIVFAITGEELKIKEA